MLKIKQAQEWVKEKNIEELLKYFWRVEFRRDGKVELNGYLSEVGFSKKMLNLWDRHNQDGVWWTRNFGGIRIAIFE